MKTIEKANNHAVNAEFLDDIIFEGRNHNYGAYLLRKNYNNHLLLSLLAVSAFTVLIVFLPFLHGPMITPVIKNPIEIIVTIDPTVFPVATELPPPPAKKPANPNVQPVINNGVPLIVDEEAGEDPTPQDVLINEIGSKEIPEVVPIIPPVTTFNPPEDINTTFNETQVTTQALFMDGTVENFRKWLAKRIYYPEEAVINDVKGTVILRFTIDKLGKICDINLMRGVHPAIDQAAIDALKRSPKWTAATIHGKPVRVSYVVPIAFCILK